MFWDFVFVFSFVLFLFLLAFCEVLDLNPMSSGKQIVLSVFYKVMQN